MGGFVINFYYLFLTICKFPISLELDYIARPLWGLHAYLEILSPMAENYIAYVTTSHNRVA